MVLVSQSDGADDASAEIDAELIDACGLDPHPLCEWFFEQTGNTTLTEVVAWMVDLPLTVLLILLVAWIASRLARRHVQRAVHSAMTRHRDSARRSFEALGLDQKIDLLADEADPRREARANSISRVVGSTATVIIWSVAIIMILGQFDVNLAPLIASAGIAGVALGFGAQSLVKDCISGTFALLEDQYGVGDVVDLGEAVGVVEELTLRVTVVRSVDGTVWHVPNGEVHRVGNMSQLWSVALIDIDVAYDADLPGVRDILVEAANAVCESEEWRTQVLEAPDVLGVETLGADGITMRLVVKTVPGAQWQLQRVLREALKHALDDAAVEIPFPQRTIWMRNAGT